MTRAVPDLEFSRQYTPEHAQHYEKQHRGLWRRLTGWPEHRMAARALRLAGQPKSILALPSCAGRFWPLLARDPDRSLISADYSTAMLQVAHDRQPPKIANRFRLLQRSAFDIKLPDQSVECIFSMHLIHHIGGADHRLAVYREFARIARQSVVVSLWVDGNCSAWRRRLRESRSRPIYQDRFVLPREQVEREFLDAGLDIVAKVDLCPYVSMWRTYVLCPRREGPA